MRFRRSLAGGALLLVLAAPGADAPLPLDANDRPGPGPLQVEERTTGRMTPPCSRSTSGRSSRSRGGR